MNEAPDMTDVAFGLRGELVPAGYAFALWDEVARCLPWLEADEFAGIVPLRAAASGGNMLLPRRAKLVLRLRSQFAQRARSLTGRELDVGGSMLRVGEAEERSLKPYPTLHAQLVESASEEGAFLAGMAARLQEMEVACKLVCGKRLAVAGEKQQVAGYSLVLHDLKPEGSLQVQRMGLGGSRRFGCGIFVPYKTIVT
ncbi:MAG: type I-MYXAN CRISPR-associated protein Cas6/Cmx6 [Nitrosomonadales bacterium]|nr:type I-MYXAN CRISPR-associated protein Cas6/Cmx6 [Nitrosomonadales bacterium]